MSRPPVGTGGVGPRQVSPVAGSRLYRSVVVFCAAAAYAHALAGADGHAGGPPTVGPARSEVKGMGRSAAAADVRAQVRSDFGLFLRLLKGIGSAGTIVLLMVVPVSATLAWHWLDLGLRALLDDAWVMWLLLALMADGLSLVHGAELGCRPARPLRRVTSPLVAAVAQGVKAYAALWASISVERERILPPAPPLSPVRALPPSGAWIPAVTVRVLEPVVPAAELEEASAANRSDDVSTPRRRLCVLGGYRLEGGSDRRDDDGGRCWWTGGERLLGLLALHRRGMSRDAVLEAFFPDRDAERGLASLRQAVRAARALLGPAGTVERRGDRYAISGDRLSVDLWEFEDAAREAREAPAGSAARLSALRAAAAAYTGDLLHSVTWTWCEASEVTAHRQDLHRAAMAVLEELAQVCDSEGDVAGAAAALDQALRLQPTAEHLVRAVMQLHAQRGCYEAARLTFQALRDRLDEDGVRPQVQTVELARRLLDEGQAGGVE